MSGKESVSDVPQINYVAKDNFRKDSVNKSMNIQRQTWPARWGFMTQEYRQMNQELCGGTRTRLPCHEGRVKAKDVDFGHPPRQQGRPPLQASKVIGGLVGTSIITPTYKWLPTHKSLAMHKVMGWPEDHQW